MVDVSVIIPAYNVEAFIERCIDSLLKQTYKNYEIIIVNDGSTDKTLKVLKKYNKNSNIKIFTQKNSGPAVARNKGIELSIGKYIMFVDSDDFVDNTYIENHIKAIKNSDLDLVVGGYKRYVKNKVTKVMRLKDDEFAKYLITAPYTKIYKKRFLIDNKIAFLDTNSSEDIAFNVSIYNKTTKIKIIDDVGYYYYFNEKSISNTSHKGFKQEIKILELLDYINYKDSPNLLMNQYFIIKYCIWYLLYSGKNVSVVSFMFEYNKLFNWLQENISNYQNNKYISLFRPRAEPFTHRFIIYVFMKFSNFHKVKLFAKIYCKGDK